MGTDAVARIGQKNAFVNEGTAERLLLASSTDFAGVLTAVSLQCPPGRMDC
jgi:hypothetical protein